MTRLADIVDLITLKNPPFPIRAFRRPRALKPSTHKLPELTAQRAKTKRALKASKKPWLEKELRTYQANGVNRLAALWRLITSEKFCGALIITPQVQIEDSFAIPDDAEGIRIRVPSYNGKIKCIPDTDPMEWTPEEWTQLRLETEGDNKSMLISMLKDPKPFRKVLISTRSASVLSVSTTASSCSCGSSPNPGLSETMQHFWRRAC